MTRTPLDDPIEPTLIGELRNLLVSGGLLESINLRINEQDGWVQLHVMAVSMSSVGVLLATLSDEAELDDLNSLSCRITPADHRVGPDPWQYELITSRYPTDNSIVFAAKIRLPAVDLPEVVSRLRKRHLTRLGRGGRLNQHVQPRRPSARRISDRPVPRGTSRLVRNRVERAEGGVPAPGDWSRRSTQRCGSGLHRQARISSEQVAVRRGAVLVIGRPVGGQVRHAGVLRFGLRGSCDPAYGPGGSALGFTLFCPPPARSETIVQGAFHEPLVVNPLPDDR